MEIRDLVRRLEKIEEKLTEKKDEDTLAMVSKLI